MMHTVKFATMCVSLKATSVIEVTTMITLVTVIRVVLKILIALNYEGK